MRLNILIILALSLPCFAYSEDSEDKLHSDDDDDDTKVIGGEAIRIYDAPYHATIQLVLPQDETNPRKETQLQHICSATIIGKKWLLTAAHCVREMKKKQLRVITGVRKWTAPLKDKYIHKVKAIIIHENFAEVDGVYDSDIALLKLKKPLKFARRIEKTGLPKQGFAAPEGMRTVITGWGTEAENETEIPEVLRQGKLKVVDYAKCRQIYADIGIEITDNMFCAGSRYTGVCKGDNGGPLVLRNKKVIGLMSWYHKCGDPKFPAVFTQVGNFVEWIDHATS